MRTRPEHFKADQSHASSDSFASRVVPALRYSCRRPHPYLDSLGMGRSSVNGQLDLLLLGSLGAGETHGYALIARIHERSGERLELQEGSVYPALHKLEAAGWVASRWAQDAGGRRRVYALTTPGHTELARRTEEWKGFSTAVWGVLGVAS